MAFLTVSHPKLGEKKLHIDEVLKITTKNRRTVLRWIRDPENIDSDSYKLLQMYAFGILPSDHPAWACLYVHNDCLYSHTQTRFELSADQIGHIWLLHELNRNLKRELADLRPAKTKPAKKSAVIFDFSFFLGQAKAKPKVF